MLDDDVIVEAAPAKLNLALHVRARRPDGYHELETLFAFATDGDVVTLAPAETDSFVITGPFAAGLDGEADNLVTRAARRFAAAFAPGACHAIALEKNLPVASGIGGGSADAAATLRALARLHGIGESEPALRAIARGLGADVPPCFVGQTALGTGRGDDLELLDPLGGVPALLINPGVAVSTASVFAGWDGIDRGPIAGDGSPLDRARLGRNDLTAPAVTAQPVIGAVLDALSTSPRQIFARMSGSGATCFALFGTLGERDAAAVAIRRGHEDWWLMATKLV